ncbi:MAG: hypothetical protein KDI66_08415 [Xanthomonadales bacterium]|nr:hypothetical protein [Xanthomonadales bacterium]
MGLLTLLDVLLGLFFVYMLFALIASAVNEAIASVLNSRAKWLRRGLSRLLQPSEMARILSSPRLMFIEGEFKSQEGKTFNPSYLRWSDLLHALCSRDGSPVDPPSMTSISDRIAEMPESPIKTILSELASEANMSMEAFERAFERWYEGFENSLRSWYRQKTHRVLMGISMLLAIIFNVDSINLMRHLSTNVETRTSLAAQAIDATRGETPTALPSSGAIQRVEATLRELRASDSQDLDAISAAEEELSSLATKRLGRDIVDQIRVLEATGLPLGWQSESFTRAEPWSGRFWGGWLSALMIALPGLMMSAFAFTLGAPFWFDLLKRIASFRSVGPATDERKVDSRASGST